ncbi:MAG: hypothetical protein PVF46_03620 [Lysobacterales bacterium]|jgi:hypothetical protein
MDTIYSLALLVSFAAGIIALILALTLFMKRPQLGPCRLLSFRRALMIIIGLALAALLVSLAVHVVVGHPAGSEDVLGFVEFFTLHPSYLVALALPLAAGLLAWCYCSRQGAQHTGENGSTGM